MTGFKREGNLLLAQKNRPHRSVLLRATVLALTCFGFQGNQAFHQPAFAAGGIVAVDNPPAGRFVEVLNSKTGRFPGGFKLAARNGGTRLLYKCARAGAIHLVINAAFLILALALQRGFMISQTPILLQSFEARAIVSTESRFVQRVFRLTAGRAKL